MLSSSRPKPTSTVSRPRVRLKSATIGIEAPEPIKSASLPHSSVSARLAAASGFMFQSSAIARQPRGDVIAKCLSNSVGLLPLHQPERNLGGGFRRDHGLGALPGIAA